MTARTLIDGINPLVGEVLCDELKCLLVEERRLHRDGKLSADDGRDFDADKLEG
jgi:hypothetical protein